MKHLKLKSMLAIMALLMSSYLFADNVDTKEVTVSTAGTLSTFIGDSATASKITTLTISGPLNGTDIKFMRSMKNIKTLNIENAWIVEGGDSYYSDDSDEESVADKTSNNVIGNNMFINMSSLVTVKLPASAIKIGANAFCYCTGMENITIPNTVTTIGDDAFFYCTALKTIDLPESIDSIGAEVFSCCPLTTITIPSKVKVLGNNIFSTCSSLASVILPNGLITIGNASFASCKALTEIAIPSTVKEIGERAFTGCPIKSIVIPEGFTTLANSTFYSCHELSSVSLPNSLVTISDYAFGDCPALETISLKKNVTTIGDGAFTACTKLSTIYSKNPKAPAAADYTFDETTCSSAKLYIPTGAKASYMAATPWSKFTNMIEQNDSDEIVEVTLTDVETLKAAIEAQTNVDSVKRLKINGPINGTDIKVIRAMKQLQYLDMANASIEDGGEYFAGQTAKKNTIGMEMFSRLSQLRTMYMPKGVTIIDDNAFESTVHLTDITLPDSLKTIGYLAFSGCPFLKNATFPECLQSVGNFAFYNCMQLGSVHLGKNVNYLGEAAFTGCANMGNIDIDSNNAWYVNIDGVVYDKAVTTVVECSGNKAGVVTIPNTVKTIGGSAFDGCSAVTTINIPEGLTSIGNDALSGCLFTTITLPASLTNLGENTFASCDYLESIYCKNVTPPTCGDYCFDGEETSAIKLYVPTGSKKAYAAQDPWSGFNIIEKNMDGVANNNVAIPMIYKEGNNIVVENYQGNITVVGDNGQFETSTFANNNRTVIPMNNKGMFIVKTDKVTMKIIME